MFTLREELRLRAFESMILRRIFAPKRNENGQWRRLHIEELHSLTCTPTGKRPLVRPRRRWENKIRIDLNEIGVNTRN